MSVTERLMQAGQWDLILSPDTPKATRDLIDYFGHVFVFDTPQRPGQSDASLIAASRWGGMVRIKQTPWQVGGVNMIGWLGDEDGRGDIYETAIVSTTKTYAQVITDLINNASGAITIGTLTAGGATKSTSYQYVTPRDAIDATAALFGKEYRVNKDATIDAGASSDLFVVTPTAAAIRRSSGRDQNIVGISVTQLDVATDCEEYITRAIVLDASGVYTGSAGTTPPYKDLHGNNVILIEIFPSSLTSTANAPALAANLVASHQALRQQITLSTDEFDIDRDVKVGDWIWVYDEDGNLKDTTNQIRYRGSFIYPLKVRVLASTWPIERGMSVWYRSGAAVWTDLTNFVQYEDPGATFEVGAPIRALTKS